MSHTGWKSGHPLMEKLGKTRNSRGLRKPPPRLFQVNENNTLMLNMSHRISYNIKARVVVVVVFVLNLRADSSSFLFMRNFRVKLVKNWGVPREFFICTRMFYSNHGALNHNLIIVIFLYYSKK